MEKRKKKITISPKIKKEPVQEEIRCFVCDGQVEKGDLICRECAGDIEGFFRDKRKVATC